MAELVSRGDIRILGGLGALNRDSSAVLTTQFATPGDLTLTAAQIYPETGAVVRVAAGVGGKRDGQPGFEAGSRLVIRRAADQLPDMPYSAFGTLRLAADIIEQGGVLRAPLGLLEIGEASTNGLTSRVTLLPGSVTSVSGRGLTMPYGGTVDGVGYQWLGQDVRLTGQGGGEYHGSLSVGLQLAGQTVQVGDNALVDLSGGGQLLGAGFISGRGGSTDARFNPLVQTNPQGGFTLPGLSTNPVYALVPGAQPMAAPTAPDAGQSQPQIGQQVTIGAGVPGLPLGTYTLMPSTYALMPGAFRVEINGATPGLDAAGALRLRNGSWSIAYRLGNASAGIADAVPRQLLISSGQVLRQYSQYNEMDYAAFVAPTRRAVDSRARWRLPMPARCACYWPRTRRASPSASPHGPISTARGGNSGTLAVASMNSWQDALEITAPGAYRSAGFNGLSLDSAQLNRLGAPRLMVGATPTVDYRNIGNIVYFGYGTTHFQSIALRAGAQLTGAEVFLVAGVPSGSIVIERGASINTVGRGAPGFDSSTGFTYRPGPASVVAVSNGWINLLPPDADQPPVGAGAIRIGACGPAACAGEAQLYSEGTIAFATNKAFELDNAARYGARYLTLAVGSVNAGSEQALADAPRAAACPAG
ncbi:hypothetical protein WJ970_32725 [Achromobacter xylosoxidans]